MRKIIFLFALALMFLLGFQSAYAEKVLILGDSHTGGPFGAELERLFTAAGDEVTIYGCWGATANNYINGGKITVNGQEMQCNSASFNKKSTIKGPYDLPNVKTITDSFYPDVVIVALGANYVNGDLDQSTALVTKLYELIGPITTTKCYWVGPPTAPDEEHNPAPFYQKYSGNVGQCTLISSMAHTSFNFPNKNEIHFDDSRGNTGGTAVAKSWAQNVFARVKGTSANVPAPATAPASTTVVPVGAKQAETYNCANKVFGLVGASNTVDADPQGNKFQPSVRNVNIIQELCPGSTVYLHAKGATWPGVQKSLVQALLKNDNLDYVILDPSANGQQAYSGIAPEKYKEEAINLAQMIKDKSKSIKVIMLTNTPTKGAGDGYGTPETIQRIKAFNADLLKNKLGRPDLIDYAVDTYSAIESSPGSDTCGYCGTDKGGLGDGIHFWTAGRKKVMQAVMNTIFGSPVSGTSQAVSGSTASAENCKSKQRCTEIDEVWQKLTQWLAKAKKGQFWDTIQGWKQFQKPSVTVNTIKTPISNNPSSVKTTSSETTAANKLYLDLMQKLSNENLAKAMVANAKAESSIKSNAAGDCGSYAEKNSGSSIPVSGKGRCCSFGLWQYNICGGLGVTYLSYYSNPSSDESKLLVLQDYPKNIEFMADYLKKTYPDELTKQKSVDEWVDWFVRTIERPSNPSAQVALRQGYARDLESAGAFSGSNSAATGAATLSPVETKQGATVFFKNSKLEQFCSHESLECVIPQQNVLKVEAPGSSNCPLGMVLVGKTCIDQYEAMLVNKDNGEVWSPYCNPGNEINNLRAASIAGVVPQSTISQVQAKQACENSGKRLCTSEEWLFACKGPEGRKYPYGSEFINGACADQFSSPGGSTPGRSVDQFCKSNGNPYAGQKPDVTWNDDPWMIHPKNNQQENSVDNTGSNTQCKTPDNVYDLSGNLDELMGDTYSECNAGNCAIFRGGFYHRTDQQGFGAGCDFRIRSHATSYSDYSLGFRCCADPTS